MWYLIAMDLSALRALLRPHVVGLSNAATHKSLADIWKALGLPITENQGSKHERMTASFDAVADSDLEFVASRLLRLHPPEPATRNQIQDALWALRPAIEVPKRFRREIARALESGLFVAAQPFNDLLDALFVLDDDPLRGFFGGSSDRSLRAGIERHVFRNPGDWSVEDLFEKLGAFDVSHPRFVRLIEGLASSDVRPDEAAQRKFAEVVNGALGGSGLELRETDSQDGYPVFTLVQSAATGPGRPKNLIFASSIKPDLRFRDALNNDIEIVTNADKVLVYDRVVSSEGLRWADLQAWWSEIMEIHDDAEAKATLYRRLRDSLPANSPPQVLLFDSYYRVLGTAVPSLPALLPEVWLHWDPMTVKDRGPQALLRFRMDFLLLLPHGVRVVIEVDGKHHYADDEGWANPAKYAALTAADRDLKLAGYQVFRFGADELRDKSSAQAAVKSFFIALFKKYAVRVPARPAPSA